LWLEFNASIRSTMRLFDGCEMFSAVGRFLAGLQVTAAWAI
jgi:hypothetical protein